MSKSRIQMKLPIFLGAACALMMVLVFVICNTFSVAAATVASGSGTWISGKLTYTWAAESNGTTDNGATGSVSVSNSKLTVSATNSKEVSGCSTTAAEATTTTVTATNASSYPIKITTLTTTGSASVSGVSQGDTIASGATFKVTVTAPAVSSSTAVSGTVTIAVEEKNKVNITAAASPYVGYTVDGHTVAQNGSDVSFEANVGTTITLPSITAPSGYEFKGWRVGSSMTTASSFTADADYTVFPVIISSGIDITAANFKVGSNTYTFWEDAAVAAVSGDGKIFVNLEDVTLPDNVLDNLLPASGGTYVKPISGGGVEYILPASVTLVLPYSTSTTVHTTTPAYGYKARVAPSPFRTLTVPDGAKITVNGSVSVDSYVCAYGQSNQGNGTPSGPHGKIVMKSGSEMTFNSNASLYCWGYINGDGNIYMESGSKVYELFQFCDWRGGNGTKNINGNSQRVFPMSQYYVQNVEAPMRIYKGATEYVWSVVNMSSNSYPTDTIEFIGTNGMFKLTGSSSDYITKRYHANVDRLEITAHGDMSLNNLTVKVSGLPLIGSITMNSSSYVLPLNNMNIVIETGTTSIASNQTYGVAFLPSSKLTVNEGATFSANAPVYFYDSEDWGGYCGASNLKLVVSGYSTANGTTAIRTADNLKDAELDVNGTVTVGNKLYTTEHGANITSSEGTGVINFTTACATGTATTYQATQSGTDISYVNITVNNAWLQNGDESYSKTVSTGTSTWKYDKSGEHWYRYLVDFNYNNNLIKRDYFCENNDTVTYDASWLTNLGATASNGTAAISGTNVNVTGVTADSVVTLTGTPAEYIPTFVLNEKQYSIYQLYTNYTITNTTTINGETYYIVDQADAALAVGTTYAAPSDASMGISAENHNTITWNMSGLSATSGDPYRGTVPAGDTPQAPVYIYGFYTGVVAYNSYTDAYYDTLIGAFEVLPQDATATITLLADCGTFEDESGTQPYSLYPDNNITLDLNGHNAVGRIINQGAFTLELNGGTLDYHTGSTAISTAYKATAAIINNGAMTIQDSAGGGSVTADATSNTSGSDGSAVIRNNAGATLTVTGKGSDDLLTIAERQKEVAYNSSYGYYAYNYGIYNLGRITALTNVDITTDHSRTTGVNIYNYNTGVIDLISGGHMYAYSGSSVFNYGGTITMIDGVTIDGKNGITNRNIRGGALASGYTVANADIGTIGTITNCDIEVGQYAIYNHAKITTIKDSTIIAQPDTAQVDTRGDGLDTASDGNIQCYTVYNSYEWWYNTNVWKQVDSTSGGYTRVNYYKEEEQYRPTIGTITNCEIYALNTSTSASYGQYAFVNYGVINTIGGTTNIKAEKHPDNTKSIVSYYGLHNLGGGIIKSIEGTVNVSVTGIGAVYNNGQFTTRIDYTYSNKVGGILTNQKETYGEPSTINSITCSGTWSCGGSSSYYYALYNTGYIDTINSTGLTLTGGYNVLYNATGGANSTYEITKKYTDGATASTEYERDTYYVKNLEKGSTIGTINGITVKVKGTKVYQGVNNQGHIGTLSNVTVGFADGATNHTSNYPLVLNGDSRYQSYTETILTNRTAETDPHLTVSAGIVTRYDRDYTYTTPPTIDTIDNLTVTSIGPYAMRNAGHIGTLKNSTITGTTYSLHNYANGPYTERQTRQYYSGTGIFTTKKNAGELNIHYKRNPATIDLIDNCTITTPASTYAMFNSGHVGTIKNSTLQAGTTTAKAYALANFNSQEREYTRDLESILYVTANSTTACTAYYGSGGESDVVTYDYDVPTIDLIGEGNTFKATTTVIANTGTITAINSGEGTLTTVTGSAAKSSSIYNYSACLDSRTTTTPYTAAEAANASGTAGTATYDDTLLSGAQIGTIKNVYVNANGYGILNGDGNAGKTPTIGEIGDGTEIYAHCTTAGYYAIANANYAKITEISGGLFKVTKATTNAYRNGNSIVSEDIDYATLISGGYFQGASNTRDNAIYKHSVDTRVTYPTGKKLSSGTTTPTPVHTDTMGGNYYYIADEYTVTFDMQGHGTAPDSQTVESGLKATQPDAPEVGDTVTENGAKYRFDGWYKEAACTNEWKFSTDTVTADTILYAKWTQVYTITWKDDEGTVIDTTDVESGQIPSHDDPIKAATAQYTYTFTGWSPTLSPATEDAEYTATFSSVVNTYTVTWKNGDTTLETDTNVEYGSTPTYDGDTPTKAATAQYTYTFSGWSDGTNTYSTTETLPNVSGNVTYTAQFTETTNTYTVTWVDGGGNTIETDENVEYGTTPTYDGDTPTKAATAQYTYTFSGWSPEISEVSGDVTYTAQFTSAVRKYATYYYNRYYDATGAIPAPAKATYAASAQSLEYSSTDSRATQTAPSKSLVTTTTLDYKYTYTRFLGWYVTIIKSSKYKPVYDTSQTSLTTDQITPEFLYQKAQEGKITAPGGKIKVTAKTYCFAVYEISSIKEHTVTMYDATDSNVQITKGDAYSNVNTAVEYGSIASAPTKTNTAQYTYTYTGWSTAAEYEAAEDKTVPAHTASEQLNVVYDAQTYYFYYSSVLNQYTVTWKNGDTAIETDENVPAGTAPSYDSTMPTKDSTAQYSYTFAGWSTDGETVIDSLPNVTADVTYKAVFTQTERTYNVKWIIDGTTEEETYTYGATPTHADPTKVSTVGYDYTFNGWTPEITTVTADATYTAVFTESPREYTITWVLGNGTDTTFVAYGEVPSYEATGYQDGIYTYRFTGWDKELTAVIGPTTYYAKYELDSVDSYKFFTENSLTLNGSIGINFKVVLPEGGAPSDYTYDFVMKEKNLSGELVDYNKKEWALGVPFEGNAALLPGTENKYKLSYAVDAPEMTDIVVATLYFKGTQVDTTSFKVSDYAAYVVPGNDDTELVDGAYYVVGTIMGKDCWQDNINLQYKMTQNPNNASEYMLENIELQPGDKIKVIQYHENDSLYWYPNGTGNEYIVGEYYGTQECSAGTFTVYVNPTNDNNTQTNWDGRSGKQIYVEQKTDSASILPSLLRAMQNYGSKAQVYFNHYTTDLADSSAYVKSPNAFAAVTDEMLNARLGTEGARDTSSADYRNTFSTHGLTYAGHTLVLNSNTRLRFYFTVSSGFDLDSFNQASTFTINGVKKDNKNNTDPDWYWGNNNHTMIYYEVDNIEAANLDSVYTLSDGTNTMDYSPLDYVRLLLGQSNEALKNLGQSLYWYNYYADLYFDAVADERQH